MLFFSSSSEDVLRANDRLKDKVLDIISVQIGLYKNALSKGFTHGFEDFLIFNNEVDQFSYPTRPLINPGFTSCDH
ncbi:hypothetical protein BG000_009500 [Podila horticola]|nr:hypothetical protein BG000_009500 [Podila horticola]